MLSTFFLLYLSWRYTPVVLLYLQPPDVDCLLQLLSAKLTKVTTYIITPERDEVESNFEYLVVALKLSAKRVRSHLCNL